MRTARMLLLALPVAVACALPAQIRYEESLETAPGAARHGLDSERLDELMRRLERLYVARLPQAMDVPGAERRSAEEVARLARALGESAELIEGVAPELGLDDAERAEFVRLARRLRERSLDLAESATALSPDELRARARGIEATCNDCHDRFRIPREAEVPR